MQICQRLAHHFGNSNGRAERRGSTLEFHIDTKLQATQTLVYATLVSMLLTLVTIFWPLRRMGRLLPAIARGQLIAAGAYFALIGLGSLAFVMVRRRR